MPELNASIPQFYCFARKEYLCDHRAGRGELVPVCVFGITSIPSRAVGFSVLTEGGAQIDRLPITALIHREDAPDLPLDHLELWDCFGYNVTVTVYEFLKGLRATAFLKDKSQEEGEYMFTIDWYGNNTADEPGEGGHKSGQMLRLDNGCFAILPNNRIYPWREPSFITGPFEVPKDYRTSTHTYRCELSGDKWATSPDQSYFYAVQQQEDRPKCRKSRRKSP